jgi:hypothetical protein
MKIVRTEILIDAGGFGRTEGWRTRYGQICKAIKAIDWPRGSGRFTLYDQSGKKRGEGSGVKPIKDLCMNRLHDDFGWSLETRIDIATVKVPGPLDATCTIKGKLLCVEWETGNISSSHRAINKMCLGMLKGLLIAGVLILPTRKMYHYLTDRVGNFSEIEPYFPFWQSIPVREGILAVMAIEHDAVSLNVPRIEKGTDGRALQ